MSYQKTDWWDHPHQSFFCDINDKDFGRFVLQHTPQVSMHPAPKQTASYTLNLAEQLEYKETWDTTLDMIGFDHTNMAAKLI